MEMQSESKKRTNRLSSFHPQSSRSKSVQDHVRTLFSKIKYISGSNDAAKGYQKLDKALSEHELSMDNAQGSSLNEKLPSKRGGIVASFILELAFASVG